jgi:acyl-CoA synthetase (AMP-forming)/AMP-acid ligase II
MRSRGFATVSELIAAHAQERPDARAIVADDASLTFAELDALMDRVAAGLQRNGAAQRTPIAIVSSTTSVATAVFLGALRAGCVPAPIAPSSTPVQVATMIADSGTPIVFVDADAASELPEVPCLVVRLDALDGWLPPEGTALAPVSVAPSDPFNIIYSSGTTGKPKGIVHDHAMRWTQIAAYAAAGFNQAVTIVATPLYSNTTLVSLLPTLGHGGTAVLMGKFDARRFLEIAQRERATHVMLVPVQYQRLMAVPDFDSFDLSNFVFKSCTSAPFAADLKADVVKRWPGLLLEVYGMTEGGGTCLLYANDFPNKLHTVGQPAPGNDIRLIDEDGREVAQGDIGEIVGRSGIMMAAYHGRPEATSAAEWHDADGNRYIRHGDLGRFDEDGFLTLLGRSKDMIISGGFNIYPPDIESVILEHPAVEDAAIIGVPSDAWGETPYAYFVSAAERVDPTEIVAWVNARVGKTQRLSGAERIATLPRSDIGKVLKRELRETFEVARLASPIK